MHGPNHRLPQDSGTPYTTHDTPDTRGDRRAPAGARDSDSMHMHIRVSLYSQSLLYTMHNGTTIPGICDCSAKV